jgi:hypothetical protein
MHALSGIWTHGLTIQPSLCHAVWGQAFTFCVILLAFVLLSQEQRLILVEFLFVENLLNSCIAWFLGTTLLPCVIRYLQ